MSLLRDGVGLGEVCREVLGGDAVDARETRVGEAVEEPVGGDIPLS